MAAPLVIAPPARFRLYFATYCLAPALFLVVFVAEGLVHGAPVALIAIGPLVGLVLLVWLARSVANQDLLAHSTITLTPDTYSHLTQSLHEQAARTMDAVLGLDVDRR